MGSLTTIEGALEATERDVEGALRSATAAVRELKRALAAARTGQVRDLRKSLSAARTGAAALAADAGALADGFDFDEQAYLSSGEYVKELLAEAEARGLSIVEDDERLLCYPSLVRIVPESAAVEIDKVKDRRLRPSILVTRSAASIIAWGASRPVSTNSTEAGRSRSSESTSSNGSTLKSIATLTSSNISRSQRPSSITCRA